MGLICGNLMGANLHNLLQANAASLRAYLYDMSFMHTQGNTALYLTRYAIGLTTVLIARAVAKDILGLLLVKVFGAKIKPSKGETQLSLTGFDLAALATQKFFVYMTLSTGVTAGCPALFHLLGLY